MKFQNLLKKIYLIFINDNPLIDLYAGIYDLEINKFMKTDNIKNLDFMKFYTKTETR